MGQKITLDIGMRADTSACDKAVAAVESIQGATKNANRALVASMRSMSHAIGGTVGVEISEISGLISELGKSGLWGGVTFVLNSITSLVIKKFQEMQAEAKRFAEYCKNDLVKSIESAAKSFGKFAEAQGRLRALGASAASVAMAKVENQESQWGKADHDLFAKRESEAAEESEKAVVKANAALAAARGRRHFTEKKNEIREREASEEVASKSELLARAQQRLASVEHDRTLLEENFAREASGWYKHYVAQFMRLEHTNDMFFRNVISDSAYERITREAKEEIAAAEEEHRDDLAKLKSATDARIEAEKALRDAEVALAVAEGNAQKAKLESARSLRSADIAVSDAEARLATATEASAKTKAEAAKKSVTDVADRRLAAAKEELAQAELAAAATAAKGARASEAEEAASRRRLVAARDALIVAERDAAVATVVANGAATEQEVAARKRLADAEIKLAKARESGTADDVRAARRERSDAGDGLEDEASKTLLKGVSAALAKARLAAAKAADEESKRTAIRDADKMLVAAKDALAKAQLDAAFAVSFKAGESEIVEANVALAKARLAAAKAEQDRKGLVEGTGLSAISLSAADKDLEQVKRVCAKKHLDANRYIDLYVKSLLVGRTREDALAAMRERLTGELAARGKSERDAAERNAKAADEIGRLDGDVKRARASLARIVNLQDAVKRGRALDDGHDYRLDENGNVITAHDFVRAKKKADDDAARQERRRRGAERIVAREDADAERLMKKRARGFRLLDSEQRRLDQWKEAREQRKKREDAEKALADAEKAKKAREEKFARDVSDIAKALKDGIAP